MNSPVLVEGLHPDGAGTDPAMETTKTTLLTLDNGEMFRLEMENALLTREVAGLTDTALGLDIVT